MDKLKIMKTVVLLMTLSIVFVLCFGLFKIIKGNARHEFSINLNLPKQTKIEKLMLSDKYLLIRTDSAQIHIINVENGEKKGVISLWERENNGQEEK